VASSEELLGSYKNFFLVIWLLEKKRGFIKLGRIRIHAVKERGLPTFSVISEHIFFYF